MSSPTFSIVICTYNRAPYLRKCLESLRFLRDESFEVVVVNGPSTDDTEAVLAEYRHEIKIGKNDRTNLSISRNVGIRLATGPVVAFIDDDAQPDPRWLADLAAVYRREHGVGGVGGAVVEFDRHHFRNGFIDLWGRSTPINASPGEFNDPHGWRYNILMGVNSSFLREALVKVGGFDEYFEYFHDESDLCVRIIRAGYRIVHHPDALVHHEFAPSAVRKTSHHLNWYPIVKNTVYFGLKNSQGLVPLRVRLRCVRDTALHWRAMWKSWVRSGEISRADYARFSRMWVRGVIRGTRDGLFAARRTATSLPVTAPFLRFATHPQLAPGERLRIALVSKSYPPSGTGGVATYTEQLATALARRGHDVVVITRGPNGLRYERGVTIHQIPDDAVRGFSELASLPVVHGNVCWSFAVNEKLRELAADRGIDVVEGPVWDYEALVTAVEGKLPVVVRLETPLRLAMRMGEWPSSADLELSVSLERRLLEMADGIISISHDVASTVSREYDVDLGQRATVIPLGVVPRETPAASPAASGGRRVLFVGRIERRKGVHVLLDAIAVLAPELPDTEYVLVGNDRLPWRDGRPLADTFRERYGREPWAERVRFLGEVTADELERQYAACDVFVAPSLYESFGLVYLEAMRHRKPVIGCRTGGVPEIVDHEQSGLLVEPGDAAALARAIHELLQDPARRAAMGAHGERVLRERFGADLMAERTLAFYRDLCTRLGCAATSTFARAPDANGNDALEVTLQ
jgi:glycosyltransferase involved in cell wall biosynthesis